MKLLDMFGISNESIDFQKNNFGKELENVFSVIAEIPYVRKEEIVTHFKIFDAIILKYTGLKTKFQHSNFTVASTRFIKININSVLLNEELKHWYAETDTSARAIDILKKAQTNKEKHTVNLKTSRVTGIFSDFESDITIDINFFKNYKITPSQMTAILLHEIGHIFTYYEFISRQVTTNQVLLSVCKSVINKDNSNEREFIFKEALELIDIKEDNVKSLSSRDDLRVITGVCIKGSIDKLQSELGVNGYDATSSEMLADQYVSRQGYGREHIEALDFISKLAKDYAKSSSSLHFVNFSQAFMSVFTITGSGILLTVGAPVLSLFALLSLGVMIGVTGGEVNKDQKYDDLKVRFLRIREDAINYLKNKDLEPDYIKKAIANLEVIDKIIKDTQETRFLFDVIVDFINPKSKKIRNSMELQRNLEALAMNDFFVKSATLSTI